MAGHNLTAQIKAAQCVAQQQQQHQQQQQTLPEGAAAGPQIQVGPAELLGDWIDSYGNDVSVCAIDAYGVQLSATLSQPPRPDIHLKLRPLKESGGWQCGKATLDAMMSQSSQQVELFWCFPGGAVSIWKRKKQQWEQSCMRQSTQSLTEPQDSSRPWPSTIQHNSCWTHQSDATQQMLIMPFTQENVVPVVVPVVAPTLLMPQIFCTMSSLAF